MGNYLNTDDFIRSLVLHIFYDYILLSVLNVYNTLCITGQNSNVTGI